MAGQRTGRSRFGFKMVLLAVLWCALHLKDLKAYQTLAVPGSGSPNKAELQKMTVPQLKEKLREKGKKVSGRKVELIERLLETGGARGEKRNIPEAGKLANKVTDVFVPLEETIQKLEELLQSRRVVFIRAGVATELLVSPPWQGIFRRRSRLNICKCIPLKPKRRCLKRAGRMN